MSETYEPCVAIIIATHKRYQMPKDRLYIPLHVGAEGKTDKRRRNKKKRTK